LASGYLHPCSYYLSSEQKPEIGTTKLSRVKMICALAAILSDLAAIRSRDSQIFKGKNEFSPKTKNFINRKMNYRHLISLRNIAI
jgi:hypothetical protein